MDHITLNNGVTIPQVGLGTYLLEPDDAQSAVTYALDNGYTLIDTANVYVNERAVGRGMRASSKAREEIFLETKLWPSFFERASAVDETLERLGTDYIDLYQVHYLDGVTPVNEMMEALLKHKQAGRIRAIGLSNVTPAQAAAFIPYRDHVASFQNHYSLAHRDDEAAMLETARLLGAAPLTWGSLGQGILTGKYGADVHFEKDDRRSRAVYDNFYGDKLRRNLRIVDVMRPIAQEHGVSVAAVAVRWILDHLPQSVVIAGMKSPAQAEANAVALTFRLTQDEVAALEAASRAS